MFWNGVLLLQQSPVLEVAEVDITEQAADQGVHDWAQPGHVLSISNGLLIYLCCNLLV